VQHQDNAAIDCLVDEVQLGSVQLDDTAVALVNASTVGQTSVGEQE
jgi:hypothetical protein